MQGYEEQFLFLLKCYFNNEKLPDGYAFDVSRVFSLAVMHNMLPVIFDKARETDADIAAYKNSVLALCTNHIIKSTAFESLFCQIVDEKIDAVVVKGPVCAACYQNPDMRLSSDFDIIVSPEHQNKLHNFLLENGFEQKKESYICRENNLYIEVSTQIGEGSDRQKKIVNKAFEGFSQRAVFYGKYRSLEYTENLAYLIYHAFKHFIGSGFGIKQVIDIYLFAVRYSDEIDYDNLLQISEKLEIQNFAYNVFYLIQTLFDYDFSFVLKKAENKYLHCDEFLSDLLDAGVFGKSSEDRVHSAAVVLDAVENDGKKSKLKALFPGFADMKKKFNILKFLPFLLPIFWIYRLFGYAFKMLSGKNKVSPQKSIEIADGRIDLMKKMGII